MRVQARVAAAAAAEMALAMCDAAEATALVVGEPLRLRTDFAPTAANGNHGQVGCGHGTCPIRACCAAAQVALPRFAVLQTLL